MQWLLSGCGIDPDLSPLFTTTEDRELTAEQKKAIFANGQWGYYCAGSNPAVIDTCGICTSVTDIASAQSLQLDAQGVSHRYGTNGSVNNAARLYMASDVIQPQQKPLTTQKFRPLQTADVRYLVGLVVSNTAYTSSNISGLGIALVFSSDIDSLNSFKKSVPLLK